MSSQKKVTRTEKMTVPLNVLAKKTVSLACWLFVVTGTAKVKGEIIEYEYLHLLSAMPLPETVFKKRGLKPWTYYLKYVGNETIELDNGDIISLNTENTITFTIVRNKHKDTIADAHNIVRQALRRKYGGVHKDLDISIESK